LLTDFHENLNFQETFSKNIQKSILMKIRPVGAELFNADGRTDGHSDKRTDTMKLIVAFRNFGKAPHKWLFMDEELKQ